MLGKESIGDYFPVDLLPLMVLRLRCPDLICAFEPEPACWLGEALDAAQRLCRELETIVHGNELEVVSTVAEQKLLEIRVYPYADIRKFSAVAVKLVFDGLPQDEHTRIFYLCYTLLDMERCGTEGLLMDRGCVQRYAW
jgi:hypothetical protein